MTIENFEHSHTVMGGLAGVQTMIVGLSAHLKLGHRVSELKVVGSAFDAVLVDLRIATSATLAVFGHISSRLEVIVVVVLVLLLEVLVEIGVFA